MPRCVPLEPDFGELESEHLVWRTLRDQLPDDVVLVARVGVTDSGVEREVDVLVAWPGVGIAAIEVKGGNVTHVDGKWRQSDRKGTHDIDPVMSRDVPGPLEVRSMRLGAGSSHVRL